MRAIGDVIAREFELGALSTGEWRFYEASGGNAGEGRPGCAIRTAGSNAPDDDDSLMILRTPTSPPIDLFAPLTCDARSRRRLAFRRMAR